ncbi:hypothetical protein KEJ37_00880 [Candidatus Bathyarchaeota archaeon]|nr:hypothetical protein [Candidatus Bathyarchaeota archaeon]
MKIGRKTILALGLAFLLASPALAVLSLRVNADDSVENIQRLDVKPPYVWNNTWYRFNSSLVTLIFPAGGKKPMFLWWYTKDSSNIYVVKFQGVIEYLMLDKPYYRHRFHADDGAINKTLWSNYIEPKLYQRRNQYGLRWYEGRVVEFKELLKSLHRAYLPFSACNWTLSGPVFVEGKDYWSFNFTLTDVYGHPRFKEFAKNNIEIRCRFYNKTVTETPDPKYSQYNYAVAAGQLKFDFVVKRWEWNIDKINQFLKNHGIDKEIPESRTGLALWINLASIKLESLPKVGEEVQNQAQNQVEACSRMREVVINGEYYTIDKDETRQDEKPVQATLELRERFRERIRLHFAVGKTDVPVGFLEFVPWARLLDETEDTIFVDVTASYVAAGGHLRLFICYPYFGNSTLEHDPTIGLTSAPLIPELINQKLLLVLVGATAVIVLVVAAVKVRKKPINILEVK